MNELGIFEKKGKVVVSSRDVAKCFEKEHFHVLRDIANIISKCPQEFNLTNFVLTEYEDKQGKMRPEYLLAKDGLTILATGYTGKKITKFKIDYLYQLFKHETPHQITVKEVKTA